MLERRCDGQRHQGAVLNHASYHLFEDTITGEKTVGHRAGENRMKPGQTAILPQREGTETFQAECRGFESHHPLPHLTPAQIPTESVHKPSKSACPGLPKADASTLSR